MVIVQECEGGGRRDGRENTHDRGHDGRAVPSPGAARACGRQGIGAAAARGVHLAFGIGRLHTP
jgi:hypothetical protein